MSIQRILILDTETTGLDPNKDQVIEVGCILYDIEHRAPVASFASVMFANANPAEATNGIPEPLLHRAPPAEIVWLQVLKLAQQCEAIVAHRAEFDRSFVPADLRTFRPWICSKFDLPWPKGKLGDHLIHLAVAHDVAVVQAHRALTDCDILARLFTRAAEMTNIGEMLALGLRPKKLFYSLAPFEEKDVVKAHGFTWDPSKHGKNWYRSMPPEDTVSLPFKVREVTQ